MFIKKSNYLEKKTVNAYADIFKKYADDNLEINMYHFKQGGSFYIPPPENENAYKSYLILSGLLLDQSTQRLYGSGELILLKATDDYVVVGVEEDTVLHVSAYGESSFCKTKERFDHASKIMDEIQKKDAYTDQHCYRVCELAKKMAPYLKLTGKEIYSFATAARYHDLGKINISDEVLKKPGAFSKEEFLHMKSHVLETKELLKDIFQEEIHLISQQHHERLDGSGYPYGLKGHEISPLGKALAVIDSYDAMTTDRVYKKGKTMDEAFLELYQLADIHYERKYIELLEKIVKLS